MTSAGDEPLPAQPARSPDLTATDHLSPDVAAADHSVHADRTKNWRAKFLLPAAVAVLGSAGFAAAFLVARPTTTGVVEPARLALSAPPTAAVVISAPAFTGLVPTLVLPPPPKPVVVRPSRQAPVRSYTPPVYTAARQTPSRPAATVAPKPAPAPVPARTTPKTTTYFTTTFR